MRLFLRFPRAVVGIVAVLMLIVLPIAFGQATPGVEAPELYDSPNDIIDLFLAAADWLFAFAIVFSIIFVLIAAFNFITSGGSEENVKKARAMIQYAVVGIVVAILAKSIPLVIGSLFGVRDLDPDGI